MILIPQNNTCYYNFTVSKLKYLYKGICAYNFVNLLLPVICSLALQ